MNTQHTDAEKFRLCQAEELLKLFEKDNSRPATSPEELEGWVASPRGRTMIKQKAKLVKGSRTSNN